MLAWYKARKHFYIKVHHSPDGWFTVYTHEPNAGWLHAYRAKDFLKTATFVEEWIADHA